MSMMLFYRFSSLENPLATARYRFPIKMKNNEPKKAENCKLIGNCGAMRMNDTARKRERDMKKPCGNLCVAGLSIFFSARCGIYYMDGG
jgi:hypothetical protein